MRNFDWWDLPGPSNFIARISEDIEAGKNVVLVCPNEFKDEVVSCVGESIRHYFYIEKVDLSASGEEPSAPVPADPLIYLCAKFMPDGDHIEPSFQILLSEPVFQGRLIWIEGLRSADVPKWILFMERYSSACKNYPTTNRALFCLVMDSACSSIRARGDVYLATHEMEGCIDGLDMNLYSSFLMTKSRKSMADFERRLIARTIASIALWDREIAEKLSAADEDTAFAPHEILTNLAVSRGWDRTANGVKPHGAVQKFEGAREESSAFLAVKGNIQALSKRVWSAQVSQILPVIEEMRLMIIEKKEVRKLLKVPFTTSFGEEINDHTEFEIGHIAYLLQGAYLPGGYGRLKSIVYNMRHARNELAHLKILNYDIIKNFGFASAYEYIKNLI